MDWFPSYHHLWKSLYPGSFDISNLSGEHTLLLSLDLCIVLPVFYDISAIHKPHKDVIGDAHSTIRLNDEVVNAVFTEVFVENAKGFVEEQVRIALKERRPIEPQEVILLFDRSAVDKTKLRTQILKGRDPMRRHIVTKGDCVIIKEVVGEGLENLHTIFGRDLTVVIGSHFGSEGRWRSRKVIGNGRLALHWGASSRAKGYYGILFMLVWIRHCDSSILS